MFTLAGVVVAKWSLVQQLKVSKPAHPYTFFGAKTAATFTQLNAGLLKCASPRRAEVALGPPLVFGGVREAQGRYQYAPPSCL